MSGLPPLLDVYSLALLTAMLLAGAALLVTLVHAVHDERRLLAVAGRLCLVAFGFAVFALSFHLRIGHPAGSAEALSMPAFIGAHRALVVVVALTGGLAMAARGASRR